MTEPVDVAERVAQIIYDAKDPIELGERMTAYCAQLAKERDGAVEDAKNFRQYYDMEVRSSDHLKDRAEKAEGERDALKKALEDEVGG